LVDLPLAGPDDLDAKLVLAAEAILFAAGDAVNVRRLSHLLDADVPTTEWALAQLARQLNGRGLQLMRHSDFVQLGTAPHLAPYVERLWEAEHKHRFSAAALETLSIIAYRQPITRAQVEAIRGVNSDRIIATLLGRALIREVGRLETAGRPTQYGTAIAFLEHFGLRTLDDLPPLERKEPAAPLA
jgi:segregation and condensation protein B